MLLDIAASCGVAARQKLNSGLLSISPPNEGILIFLIVSESNLDVEQNLRTQFKEM